MKNHLKIQSPRAFTLIGLVMVVAVSAVLAGMLLLMLTGARQRSQTSVCANNLKQLGLGINAYADGNKQLFPPAALEAQSPMDGGPHSWDSLINHYVGGNLDSFQQIAGWEPTRNFGHGVAPKIIACPADGAPMIFGPNDPTSRRSYSMNHTGLSAGYSGGCLTYPSCQPPCYPTLPTPKDGIGVYWQEQTQDNTGATSNGIDFHAPGYPTKIIQDAAGTILLCEHPDSDNAAGNAWQSTCIGPTNKNAGIDSGAAYQLDPNDSWNTGATIYQTHGYKFNYLFHDNHVAGLTWQQTLGTGTIAQALAGTMKGMWTIKAGD